MKKITILTIMGLLVPFFSQSMSDKKRKFESRENYGIAKVQGKHCKKKKTKEGQSTGASEPSEMSRSITVDSLVDMDQSNQIIGNDWNGCPVEIKIKILYHVLDSSLQELLVAVGKNDAKQISRIFKQFFILRCTDPLIQNLIVDKKLFSLAEKIIESFLENCPEYFFKFTKKMPQSVCRTISEMNLNSLLLRHGEKFNICFEIFRMASSKRYIKFCEQLILAGIFNGISKTNLSLIHAIYLHKLDMVRRLVEKGECKALFLDGSNQIFLASSANDIDILRVLLDASCKDIDIKNDHGDNALILAALAGYKEVVELLLDRGANIHEKNKEGNNSLMAASWKGYKEVVELLLDRGANINEKNNNGNNALIMASLNGHKKVIELLLDKGANINDKDNNGANALVRAAVNGHKEVIELLLDRDANINEKNHIGDNALLWTASKGHKEAVKLLLDRGANINDKNNNGANALMVASLNGHKELVELLLDRGADVNEKNRNGHNALTLASFNGHKELVEFLQSYENSLNQH